jgi:hypothetical protein
MMPRRYGKTWLLAEHAIRLVTTEGVTHIYVIAPGQRQTIALINLIRRKLFESVSQADDFSLIYDTREEFLFSLSGVMIHITAILRLSDIREINRIGSVLLVDEVAHVDWKLIGAVLDRPSPESTMVAHMVETPIDTRIEIETKVEQEMRQAMTANNAVLASYMNDADVRVPPWLNISL